MKLSALTFYVIGFCLCIMGLTFGYVTWKPNNDETKALVANTNAANDEAAKKSRADKRVADAKKLVEAEAAKWRSIAAVKSPPPNLKDGGIDISENGAQLIVDSRQFRNSVQTAVNKQVRVGGVKLLTDGPFVTEPGQTASTILAEYYNYPAIPFPVVIFDLGTISVSGTYEQICKNVRAWSAMPNYLAVADGLRIEGTSPHMTGTYQVSLVGYVHGNKLFTTLPEVPGTGGPAEWAAGRPEPGLVVRPLAAGRDFPEQRDFEAS